MTPDDGDHDQLRDRVEWLSHHLPLLATDFIEDHDPEWRDLVTAHLLCLSFHTLSLTSVSAVRVVRASSYLSTSLLRTTASKLALLPTTSLNLSDNTTAERSPVGRRSKRTRGTVKAHTYDGSNSLQGVKVAEILQIAATQVLFLGHKTVFGYKWWQIKSPTEFSKCPQAR